MTFARALPIILLEEGGYSNDPADKGGATNHGITQGTYDGWRSHHSLPFRSVQLITDQEVSDIYRAEYWDASNCPEMTWPLSLVHFDARVNHRPGPANTFLQQALGVKADGIVGPETLTAAIACEPVTTAMKHCDVREKFYQRIVDRDHTQEKFLKGWYKRLDGLRLEIQQVLRDAA